MSEIQQTPAQRALTVKTKSTVIQGVISVLRRHGPQSTDAPVTAYTPGTALATLSSSTHPVWLCSGSGLFSLHSKGSEGDQY